MTIIGRNYFKCILSEVINTIKKTIPLLGGEKRQIEHIITVIFILVPLIFYIGLFLSTIVLQPIIGHDVLNYAITGNMLFEEKSLAPIWIDNFAQSGYLYKIKHAPSFSMLLSWEQIINSVFKVKSDFYFKSISVYYGLLIVTVQFYWVSKQNKWLALLVTIALLSTLGFYNLFFIREVDTYRIYFLMLSLIYLVCSIKKQDMLSIFLFGFFSGLAAFTHRLSLVIVVINYSVLCFMLADKMKIRVFKITLVGILILFAGGSHYIFDIVWGSGNWMRK